MAADNISPRLKVFISYSRTDLEFADQLVAALELHAFETIIDREGIHAAENWKDRLGQLILQSDIVVFVLSPDSAASDICAWEVEQATLRGKRIVPVACRPLEGQTPAKQLQALNYIFFYPDENMPSAGFGTGLARLVEALSVDVEWLREHTRLSELADRWERSGSPESQLARGSELTGIRAWRDRRPENAPHLTDLQRRFIAASEQGEAARESAERRQIEEIKEAQARQERALEEKEAAQQIQAQTAKRLARRTVAGVLVSAVLFLSSGAAGWFAWTNYQDAQEALRQTVISKARHLTSLAAAEMGKGNVGDGLLLAVEALEKSEDLAATPDGSPSDTQLQTRAHFVLSRAVLRNLERTVLAGHTDEITSLSAPDDGSFVVSGSKDNTARIWDITEGKTRHILQHDEPVVDVAVARSGETVATATASGKVRIWNSGTGALLKKIAVQPNTRKLFLSPDGRKAASTSNVWLQIRNTDTGELVWSFEHDARIRNVTFGQDGTFAILTYEDGVRLWNTAAQDWIRLKFSNEEAHASRIAVAAMSADEQHLILGDKGGRVWKIDLRPALSGQEVGAELLISQDVHVSSVAVPQDVNQVVAGSINGLVRTAGAIADQPLVYDFRHNDPVTGLAFASDETILISQSASGTVRLLDRAERSQFAIMKQSFDLFRGGEAPRFVKPRDAGFFATVNPDHTVRIWDLRNLSDHLNFLADSLTDQTIVLEDSRFIVTAGDDGDVGDVDLQFETTAELIAAAKNRIPRCLTESERKSFAIDSEPPGWCTELGKWTGGQED
ncbi:MAG: TIR domain-containing protein [Pseudomonadota bacterium]